MFLRPPGNAVIDVTSEVALGIPALFRAVTLIANTISSLPFHVVAVDDADNKRITKAHPAYNLIRHEPSPMYSQFGFWQAMLIHALTIGDGLAYIMRRSDGSIEEIRLIDPTLATLQIDGSDLYYKVSGMPDLIYSRDMIHITGPSWNGIQGIDIIFMHRNAVSQAMANDNMLTEFYKNGAMLSGVLKHPQRLTQEKVDAYASSFKKAFQGRSNAGGVPVLHGGMEFQQIQLSPVQAGNAEAKNLTIKDIGRIYGVPGFMIGDMDAATLNNFEQGLLLFKTMTIMPMVRRIEQELNRKVFRASERWDTQVMIDMDQLSLADLQSKSDYIKTLFNTGTATINELRKELNMEPVAGGDERYVPLNMVDANAPREEQERQLKELLHHASNGHKN